MTFAISLPWASFPALLGAAATRNMVNNPEEARSYAFTMRHHGEFLGTLLTSNNCATRDLEITLLMPELDMAVVEVAAAVVVVAEAAVVAEEEP